MNRQLQQERWFVYYQGYKIWITDEQAEQIKKAIDNGYDREVIDIAGRLIPTRYLTLLKAEDNNLLEREKKGDWKCDAGYWHTKGEECGHGILNNYRGFNKYD